MNNLNVVSTPKVLIVGVFAHGVLADSCNSDIYRLCTSRYIGGQERRLSEVDVGNN